MAITCNWEISEFDGLLTARSDEGCFVMVKTTTNSTCKSSWDTRLHALALISIEIVIALIIKEAHASHMAAQIMEDVSEEHARKTITVDPFPHSSTIAASIHPCKHASVVKKLGQMAEAGGKEFRVEK